MTQSQVSDTPGETAATAPTLPENPFAKITLAGFNEVEGDKQHMVRMYTAALLLRLSYEKSTTVTLKKVAAHPTQFSDGCRFNRLNCMGDQNLHTTFTVHGMPDITAYIETGEDTPMLMTRITDLIQGGGQTVERKVFAKEIQTVAAKLDQLEAAQVVHLNASTSSSSKGDGAQLIFGMSQDCFTVLLHDIAHLYREDVGVKTDLILEAAAAASIKLDTETAGRIILWLNILKCIQHKEDEGGHGKILLDRNMVSALLVDSRHHNSFPPVDMDLSGPKSKEEKKVTVRKVRKSRRKSLAQVMGDFDQEVIAPFNDAMQKYLEASKAGDHKKAMYQLRTLMRYERELGLLRDWREKFKEQAQTYLDQST